MNYTIDINADLGEGYPYDEQIMPLISSCSIACGGHYGDKNSMRKTIQLAKKYNVKVGAHPSFPDKENFGRKVIEMEEAALQKSLINQIQNFIRICNEEHVNINHIKLHGALYNLAAVDEKISDLVIQTVLIVSPKTTLYIPGKSIFYAKAKNKIPLKKEAFIDRSYTDDGFLVARTHPKALLDSPKKSFEQLIEILTESKVTSISGKKIALKAETYCIHGDHQISVEILNYLHQNLKNYAIEIE